MHTNKLFKLILFRTQRFSSRWSKSSTSLIYVEQRRRKSSRPFSDGLRRLYRSFPVSSERQAARLTCLCAFDQKLLVSKVVGGPARIRANEFRTELSRIWIIASLWSLRTKPSRIIAPSKTSPPPLPLAFLPTLSLIVSWTRTW